jgi:hypothetical protein
MPVLHQYRDESGHYIKACIQGTVATFQLGKAGFEELAKADIGVGSKFPLSLLIDLIREGKAFTARRAAADGSESTRFHEAEQFTFDFPEDAETERQLPVCETTGSFDDLHLVGYASGRRAALLGPEAREELKGVTVSLPLHLVTRPLIDQLVASQNLPAEADALTIARHWLAQARSNIWTVHHPQPPRQEPLVLPDEAELPL